MNGNEKNANYSITDRIKVGKMTFVLGENPNAPSPFVTWQKMEGRSGYDVGNYMTDRESAVKDLHRRANNEKKLISSINNHSKQKERNSAR